MTFANLLSQLSYSNIKLTKSLSERDALVAALRKARKVPIGYLRTHSMQRTGETLQTDSYDYMSPVIEQLTGFSAREMSAMSINEIL